MTREEHADYVRWLKSLPRRKDHFRMPCPECSATRSNPKDPSFSVHITREGGWAKCFHCDFAIAWNEDEMWKREQKQQDRERQKQQKDAPVTRNFAASLFRNIKYFTLRKLYLCRKWMQKRLQKTTTTGITLPNFDFLA